MTKPPILPQLANPEPGGNDLAHIGDNWIKNTGEVEYSTSPVFWAGYIHPDFPITRITTILYPNAYGAKPIHIPDKRAVVKYPTLISEIPVI